MNTLSTVIPVYNEAESLQILHGQLCEVSQEHGYELDIIFVDDGSTDESWKVIEGLAQQDSRVRGIRFRRNFGKAAALSAGFEAARGELVMTLDADLQDDPTEIPRFLEQMEEGFDVVSGWKKKRHDPFHKVLPSRVFNALVSWLTGVKLHDHNCGFKCYRREIFDEVRLYGELHRFVPVLANARGWRVGEIVVNHRPREYGQSKYGFARFIKGLLDLMTVYFLTGYGQRPQHLMGTFGLLSFLAGGGGLLMLTVWRIVSWQVDWMEDVHLTDKAVFFYSLVALLLGAQFMSIGFVAELLTAHAGSGTATYSIKQRTGDQASDSDAMETASRN